MKKHSNEQLYDIAERQQGLFTARQAVAAGFDRRNHSYHVEAGNWIREHRGIYRLKKFSLFDFVGTGVVVSVVV